jgi:hypothetical protein
MKDSGQTLVLISRKISTGKEVKEICGRPHTKFGQTKNAVGNPAK